MLALVGLPGVSSRRIDRYQLAHVLVWLHLALTSIRNAPLFALAAAPALAAVARRPAPVVAAIAGPSRDRTPVWSGRPRRSACSILVVPRASARRVRPRATGRSRRCRPEPAAVLARLFHEQDWGGLIEAECRPIRRRVPRRPLRAVRQGGDPRIRRRPHRRPGLGHRPRPRPDRPGLGPPRSRAGQAAAQATRMAVLHRDKVSVLFRQENSTDLTAR